MSLNDVVVTGNKTTKSGGGIANYGTLNVANSWIVFNQADEDGGGIYNSGQLTIGDNSRILHNQATKKGGGIFSNQFGNALIVETWIDENIALLDGGGIYNMGFLWMLNGQMWDNEAGGNGGGIYNTEDQSWAEFDNVSIENNWAQSKGGGFYNFSGAFFLNAGCTLANNFAVVLGNGGAYRDPWAPFVGIWAQDAIQLDPNP